MKKQIRRNVFETNSSSIHAICISKNKMDIDNFPPKVWFKHGEYGWSFGVLNTPEEKASYLYQAICDIYGRYSNEQYKKDVYVNKLYDTLWKYGIDSEFEGERKDEYGWDIGYIDHANELTDFIDSLMRSEKKLLKYLFGDSFIVTGNDNDYETYEDYMSNHDFSDYEVYVKGN